MGQSLITDKKSLCREALQSCHEGALYLIGYQRPPIPQRGDELEPCTDQSCVSHIKELRQSKDGCGRDCAGQ